MKLDLLKFHLQSVLSGLESKEAGDDEEEAEDSDLEITTDEGMHEVVNNDNEGDVFEGFMDSGM